MPVATTDRARAGLVIVGAGIAGIGLAIRLKRAGLDDFVVLEAGDDVGGVWRDNVYPGVACDIPRGLYSYSFLPQPASPTTYASGGEIHDYLRDAVASEGLEPHLRLAEPMRSACWQERDRCWTVHTRRGTLEATVLVVAAGRQSTPLVPAVPGLDTYPGRAFHSSRWDARPLTGLRVGVVGTGASAVQLLPHVAAEAAETIVFQRTPAWVLPREGDSAAPATERSRGDLAAEAESLYAARIHDSEAAGALAARALTHLRRQVPDPLLREQLTPDYEIGCKRAVFSDDYFPTLQLPQVTLEPSALARVDGSAAIAASGRSYALDAIVFATGFDTANPAYAAGVSGRGGRTLAEHWAGTMRTYASTAVHGFPNMFVMGGPNAALGHNSAIEVLETQMDYILGAVAHLAEADAQLEVSPEAERDYLRLVDRLAADTVWTRGGCTSWYLDGSSRRPSLLWPAPAAEFRRRYGAFDPTPYTTAYARGR
jgi:cation diffusion facilitator CzcD-associated flavoprotein CzcO